MDQVHQLRQEYNELEVQIRQAQARKDYKASGKMNKRQFAISNEIENLYDTVPGLREQMMAEVEAHLWGGR